MFTEFVQGKKRDEQVLITTPEGKRQFQTLLESLNDIHHRISSLQQQFVTTTDCNRRPEALLPLSSVPLLYMWFLCHHQRQSCCFSYNWTFPARVTQSLSPAVFFSGVSNFFMLNCSAHFQVFSAGREVRGKKTRESERRCLSCFDWSCAWSLCVWQNHWRHILVTKDSLEEEVKESSLRRGSQRIKSKSSARKYGSWCHSRFRRKKHLLQNTRTTVITLLVSRISLDT